MENKESKSLGGILGEQLDVIKEIRKEQINIADKNDENYNAVLSLLEREKDEKSKCEKALDESRKTLDLTKKEIDILKHTTIKTEIGRDSLDVLSDVSRTFEDYVKEKKVENELRGKLEETVKELKAKEESLTSWKRWFWGVTIILTIVIVIMCVAR